MDFEFAGGDVISADATIEVSDLKSGGRERAVSIIPNDLGEFGEEGEDLVDRVYAEVGVSGVALFASKGEDSVEGASTSDFEFVTQMVD